MDVIDKRSALLSNYEVLALLKELESDQLARAKTALRIKKEEEQTGVQAPVVQQPAAEEVNENLRTVEFEAIQYLTAPYQPLQSQTEASIAQLVKDLAPYGLTKAEKLQIVNLAPTQLVELYVIVEELEDRLGDEKGEEILALVRRSLAAAQSTQNQNQNQTNFSIQSVNGAAAINGTSAVEVYGEDQDADAEGEGEGWYQDDQGLFDDLGEGAGVEGDLEMDEE